MAAQDESPRLESEGKRTLKDRYFESRRTKPGDPMFDTARARVEAVELMREQARMMAPESGVLWTNIGPAPTTNGQTPTFDPRIPSDVSGRVSAIAIDATDGAVFVGGAQGGVWKTTDTGASWTPLTDDLLSTAIGSIAIDPAAHAPGQATLYIGTGEGNGSCDSYGGVGIYKSTDSGASWSGPFGTNEFTNRGVGSIAIDRTNSSHLLATSASGAFGISCTLGPILPDRGIFRSTDGGLNWTQVTTGNFRGSVVIQDPITATTWWAAMWVTGGTVDDHNGGLLKSIDNGVTWVQQGGSGGLPARGSTWGRAWITATTDTDYPGQSVLWVANGQSSGSVWRSTNSGTTWVAKPAAAGFCGGQCFYDMPILVEPGNADILYTGGAGNSTLGALPSQAMRTTDGGTTFVDQVRSGDGMTALHADVHALAIWPGQPATIWHGNDGGVWYSTDRGANWVDVNEGLALTQYSGCDLHPTKGHVAYGGTQDNGTMGWTGSDYWPHKDFGDGGFARIDQGDPDNLVHTYFNQSNNLVGVGWTNVGFDAIMGDYCGSFAPGNGMTISDRVLFYAPIHLDRGATDTLYYGTHRLYRAASFFGPTPGVCAGSGLFSVLGGGADLAPSGGALSAIETVANGMANAMTIFTGASSGEVFRSTNGGTSFQQIDIGGSALFVSEILVDPDNTSLVLQARSGFSGVAAENVRRSVNGGTTWAASGAGLPDIPVNALAFDPNNANWVWAGTDIGTYLSTDGGQNWVPQNDGMATVAVFDLKSNPDTGSLIACTHGRSAYYVGTNIFADGLDSDMYRPWTIVVP